MQTHKVFSLLFAASLCAFNAHAQDAASYPIEYKVSGTFGSDTPVTTLSAPGDAFTVDFQLAPTLTLNAPSGPDMADVQVLGGYYNLSPAFGTETEWGQSTGEYQFSTSATNNQLNLTLSTASGNTVIFNWFNQPAGYLGSLAQTPTDPNATAWTFATGNLGPVQIQSMGLFAADGSSGYAYDIDATVTGRSTAPAPVPEPSTVGMLAVGMLSLGGYGFLFRKRSV